MTEKLIIVIITMVVNFACASCNNQSSAGTSTVAITAETSVVKATDTATNKNNTNNDSTTINSDWLLIPGVSAGQTRLNENADSIYQRLGKPDGGDAAMMKAIAVWYSHHDTTNNSIAIFTSKNTDTPIVARVEQIRVTSPAFKTASAIHTTSSLQDIKNHFDVTKTEQYQYAGVKYAIYDSKKGIAFEINTDSVCVAIIIHEAGTTNLGTYLKFRTTNKLLDKRK